jgi:hypothetical protein
MRCALSVLRRNFKAFSRLAIDTVACSEPGHSQQKLIIPCTQVSRPGLSSSRNRKKNLFTFLFITSSLHIFILLHHTLNYYDSLLHPQHVPSPLCSHFLPLCGGIFLACLLARSLSLDNIFICARSALVCARRFN